MEIYPNPAETQFTIHNALPIAIGITMGTALEISIYNALGMQIDLPTVYCLLPTVIDVHALPKGMYWIEVRSGEKVFRNKFVKQ